MREIGMSILLFVWFLVYVYRKSLGEEEREALGRKSDEQ